MPWPHHVPHPANNSPQFITWAGEVVSVQLCNTAHTLLLMTCTPHAAQHLFPCNGNCPFHNRLFALFYLILLIIQLKLLVLCLHSRKFCPSSWRSLWIFCPTPSWQVALWCKVPSSSVPQCLYGHTPFISEAAQCAKVLAPYSSLPRPRIPCWNQFPSEYWSYCLSPLAVAVKAKASIVFFAVLKDGLTMHLGWPPPQILCWDYRKTDSDWSFGGHQFFFLEAFRFSF